MTEAEKTPEKKSPLDFTNRPMKRPAPSTTATYAPSTAKSNHVNGVLTSMQ